MVQVRCLYEGELVCSRRRCTARWAWARHPARALTDLRPYLGTYGHLVALRAGDLAYLHVLAAFTLQAGTSTGAQKSAEPATGHEADSHQH
ncbi:hypothetical protein HRW16_19250 [Streptomyces lunaelactis]|nr:hypothetical protein [Streptomyces lunaelactis]NUK42394.1 hypothetical protein [Streptomyces lunaelactis]NUK93933.1 hypothetical protein [Streptomyces lunaelactis]NUL31198.1 hypothetical protein [Streptomyces lunaelactis]